MQACASSGKSPAGGRVLLFPGQGIQAIGMGSEVCDISPATRAVWDCASEVSGLDIRRLCLKGPMTRLTKTRYQQLAVTTVNVAMLAALQEKISIGQAAFLGHSAGEYSALYAAGVFDLETLFRAIDARATIMQAMAEQQAGVMYVVKEIGYQQLHDFIELQGVADLVKIANDNSPRQQVISGGAAAVRSLTHQLGQLGYGLVKLPVNGAWHSHLMADGVEHLRQALDKLHLRIPQRPIYMNRVAALVTDTEEIKNNLALHLTQRVRWRESMEVCYRHGYREFVEIGSKKILGHMLGSHFPHGPQVAISHFHDWFPLRAAAGAVTV